MCVSAHVFCLTCLFRSYWDVIQKAVQGPDGKNIGRRYYYISSVVASEITPEARAAMVECHQSIPLR